MNNQERRDEILRMLSESDACINASQFAAHFSVTRQVIVSDIALLRANGSRIQASRHGYRLESETETGLLKSIVCHHSVDQVLEEFHAVVDNGGSVVSVIVEHPIYGQLSADLNIASRYDAREFIQRLESTRASQLSDLTGGMHIHMLRVPDEAAYERILLKLAELGILADSSSE